MKRKRRTIERNADGTWMLVLEETINMLIELAE
jgi:hypothetical protein